MCRQSGGNAAGQLQGWRPGAGGRPTARGRGSWAFPLVGWRRGPLRLRASFALQYQFTWLAGPVPEDLVPLLLKVLLWLPSTHRTIGQNPSYSFGQNAAPSPSLQIQPFKDLLFQEDFPDMFESSLRSWTQFSLLFCLLRSSTFCLRPVMYCCPGLISLGARDLPSSLA